jgi:hypothetical protein
MKKFKLEFTQQEWQAVENLIGEIPTKFGNPLINMLIPKLQEAMIETEEKPKPIGGGSGGGAPKPKPSE